MGIGRYVSSSNINVLSCMWEYTRTPPLIRKVAAFDRLESITESR